MENYILVKSKPSRPEISWYQKNRAEAARAILKISSCQWCESIAEYRKRADKDGLVLSAAQTTNRIVCIDDGLYDKTVFMCVCPLLEERSLLHGKY